MSFSLWRVQKMIPRWWWWCDDNDGVIFNPAIFSCIQNNCRWWLEVRHSRFIMARSRSNDVSATGFQSIFLFCSLHSSSRSVRVNFTSWNDRRWQSISPSNEWILMKWIPNRDFSPARINLRTKNCRVCFTYEFYPMIFWHRTGLPLLLWSKRSSRD